MAPSRAPSQAAATSCAPSQVVAPVPRIIKSRNTSAQFKVVALSRASSKVASKQAAHLHQVTTPCRIGLQFLTEAVSVGASAMQPSQAAATSCASLKVATLQRNKKSHLQRNKKSHLQRTFKSREHTSRAPTYFQGCQHLFRSFYGT